MVINLIIELDILAVDEFGDVKGITQCLIPVPDIEHQSCEELANLEKRMTTEMKRYL
jgi:hypothetical protein